MAGRGESGAAIVDQSRTCEPSKKQFKQAENNREQLLEKARVKTDFEEMKVDERVMTGIASLSRQQKKLKDNSNIKESEPLSCPCQNEDFQGVAFLQQLNWV